MKPYLHIRKGKVVLREELCGWIIKLVGTIELIVEAKLVVVNVPLHHTHLEAQAQKLVTLGVKCFVISARGHDLVGREIDLIHLVVIKNNTYSNGIAVALFVLAYPVAKIGRRRKSLVRIIEAGPPLVAVNHADPVFSFEGTGECRVERKRRSIKLRKMLILS